jgi:hypothetical protein
MYIRDLFYMNYFLYTIRYNYLIFSFVLSSPLTITCCRSLWDRVQGPGSQDRGDRRYEEGADRPDRGRGPHVRPAGDLAATPSRQIQPSQHCPIDRHLPRTAIRSGDGPLPRVRACRSGKRLYFGDFFVYCLYFFKKRQQRSLLFLSILVGPYEFYEVWTS